MSLLNDVIKEIIEEKIKLRMAGHYGLDIKDPDFGEKYNEIKNKEQDEIDNKKLVICECCGQEIE